ncbi:outer membrane protein assembly factor BamB family protein [Halostella salina]|uniref:outer membrane protein assembly factor BamB family protein n=1 Tax=Halostella salina TaxID=1547897 RepID=UPI000EF7D825|nr:PQQ-binding-like beta-propeller repeat protein [Halostella salina]
MNGSVRKLLVLAVTVAMVAATPAALAAPTGVDSTAQAAGNVGWTGFQSGAANAGNGSTAADYGDISAGWSATGDTDVASGPAVVDGTVYAGDGDAVRAFGAGDGAETWSTTVTGQVFGTPAVHDGTVYAATDAGSVVALDADTGATVADWPVTTGVDGGDIGAVVGSPTVGSDGTVYVATESGTLHAIGSDGTARWSYDLGSPARTSTPAVHDGTVYVGDASGTLHAVAAADGSGVATADVAGGALNSPAVDADSGTVVATATDGTVAAYASDLSERLWRDTSTYDAVYGSAAIDGDDAVVGGSNGLVGSHALSDGATAWSATVDTKGTFGASVSAAGGTVFVGTDEGSVVVLDGADGSERDNASVGSGALLTAPTVVGPSVYVGTSDGTVEQFVDADPSFSVSDVSAPSSALTGEPVTVDVTVANDGLAGGSYTATLTAGGETVDSRTVTVAAGDSRTVSIDYTPPQSGDVTLAAGSRSTTLTVDDPASVSATGVDAPSTGVVGETVTLQATVENAGDREGTETVTFTVDGAEVGSETVTLAGGERTTVSTEYTLQRAGDRTVAVGAQSTTLQVDEPASLSVTNLDAPSTAVVDGSVTLKATVENAGDREGTETVTFTVDGTDVGSETVTLAGGERTTVSTEYTPTETGDRTVAAGGESATLSVDIAGAAITRSRIVDGTDGDGVVEPGDTVVVTASLDPDLGNVGSVEADASAFDAGSLTLADDGTGADETADDDTYSGTFTIGGESATGTPDLVVSATVDSEERSVTATGLTVDRSTPAIEAVRVTEVDSDDGVVAPGDEVTVTAGGVTDADTAVTSVTLDASALGAGSVGLDDDGPASAPDDDDYSATITVGSVGAVPSDGPATLRVTATDEAGIDGTAAAEVTVDTTAPTVERFDVRNPSGREVRVEVTTDEQLGAADGDISVALSGAETATLDRGDFAESGPSDGAFVYTATYDGSTDGTYTATLTTAKDVAGNDAADGTTSGSVDVSVGGSGDDGTDDSTDDNDRSDDGTDDGTDGDDSLDNDPTPDDSDDSDDDATDDGTDLDAEPDVVVEATIENSTASFNGTDQVEAVAFENDSANGTVTVAEYDEPPASVEREVGAAVADDGDTDPDVLSVADISPSTETAANASATVELTVDRDELDDPSNAVIVHRTADGWTELATTVQDVGDGEVTLTAETGSFSLFAVVEVERDTETTTTTTTTTTAEPTEATTTATMTTAEETTAAPTDDTSATDSSSDDSTDGSSDGGGLPGFTATAAIIALAGALVALRRRDR